jgi:porin
MITGAETAEHAGMRRFFIKIFIYISMISLIAPIPLQAREGESEINVDRPWMLWDYATGDWGGFRNTLEDHGLFVNLVYRGELFGNLRGGIDTTNGPKYAGNFDFEVMFDTEAAGFWSDGFFFMRVQNINGKGITEDYVGDYQVLSNIEAQRFTQVAELWYQHAFLDDAILVKFGKQDANADFAGPAFGGHFLNSSFGFATNIPLVTFPDQGMGLAALTRPADHFTLNAGMYDSEAKNGVSGIGTAFDGRGGFTALLEAGYHPLLGDKDFRGGYRAGAWFQSDDTEEISELPNPDKEDDNYGLYVVFDQELVRDLNEEEDEYQGLGAFFQYSWAPNDRNEVPRYVGGGLTCTGFIKERYLDIAGLGVARADFSSRLSAKTQETSIELFYKLFVTRWMAVQPDVQYIINPNGALDDALAVGVRMEISF